MKALAILGIILAPISAFFSLIFIFVIESFKFRMKYINPNFDADIVQRNTISTIESTSFAIGTTTLVLMIFYIVLFSVSMRLIQNSIVKSIAVIGLILSVFMICWDFVMMSSPMAISFDEVGIAWIGYFLTSLGFSIVMLVQYNRKIQVKKVTYKENVLDDLEFE